MKGFVQIDTQLTFADASVQARLAFRAFFQDRLRCGVRPPDRPPRPRSRRGTRMFSGYRLDPTGAKSRTAASGRRWTYDPDPCRDTITPSSRSCLSACRKTGRDTSSRSLSVCSVRSFSPTGASPLEIMASIFSYTRSARVRSPERFSGLGLGLVTSSIGCFSFSTTKTCP